jgi:PIN domain nuclease of toxin-antitoxin system
MQEMIASTRLPDYHGDPFDRLLVAIARRRSMTLVTADEHIRRHKVDTGWEED